MGSACTSLARLLHKGLNLGTALSLEEGVLLVGMLQGLHTPGCKLLFVGGLCATELLVPFLAALSDTRRGAHAFTEAKWD